MAKSASVAKLSSRHNALMTFILENPTMTYGQVAGQFHVTQAWLSTIIHSDAFQDQLKRRHDEIFDCAILQGIDAKLQAAVDTGLDAYLEKIPTMNADQLISGTDKLLNRLGFGTKQSGGTIINGNVVQINSNHVTKEVLDEARNRIGQNQVGASDQQATLPDPTAQKGTEIEGVAVRVEGP